MAGSYAHAPSLMLTVMVRCGAVCGAGLVLLMLMVIFSPNSGNPEARQRCGPTNCVAATAAAAVTATATVTTVAAAEAMYHHGYYYDRCCC